MKNISLSLLLSLCAIALAFTSCTLDKEPTIPTGATNEKSPVFASTDLAAITHDSVRASARLSSRGNLNILRHGWVWSENPNPTLQDNKLELAALVADSFETLLPGFTLGKTYHLRPYVATGSGETYGPEKTILMDIPKMDDVTLIAGVACSLLLRCSLQSPVPPAEYGIVYLKGAGTPTLKKNDGQEKGADLGNGSFHTDLTMLNPSTTYSIRAYALGASGLGYSKVKSLTTPASSLVSAGFGINTDAEIFQDAVVQFTNTSVGANNTYSWSFGDGTTSAQAAPVHIFSTLGNMTVRLTAQSGGCTLTKDTVLKVIPNPFQDYWEPLSGNTFMMGCTAEQGADCENWEKPAHQVTLSPFSIGRTEVTQGQWEAVTGNNPSFFYQCGPNCPVEYVSWNRIMEEFIPALDRKTGRKNRLPTEAEWEYAARGGQSFKYSGSNILNLVGWYDGNAGGMTHPVKEKDPNGFGLYDMSGNVYEWCSDWYDAEYYKNSPSQNPGGPSSGTERSYRAGSWKWGAVLCRVSYRFGGAAKNRDYYIGFRLALSPQ